MSRLFESFGEGSEAEVPVFPHVGRDASERVSTDGDTALLADVEFGASSAVADATGGYVVPDFERDANDVAAYEDAKRRFIRAQLAAAESAIQATFEGKREQLQRELKSGRAFEEDRRAAAIQTTLQYATAFPANVDKKGARPPSFFATVLSFGRASTLYRAACTASEALESLRAAMRKREEQLEALETQLARELALKQESIAAATESDAGLAEFHDRPEIAALYERTQQTTAERAEYATRLRRGLVGDDERRDRFMVEQNLSFAVLPLTATIIVKVARFGKLSYFLVRDFRKNESLLSYDPRLDPLRNTVFDVQSFAGTVAARLKRNEYGIAMRVADHFRLCWRDPDEADERYRLHRGALRDDRGLPVTKARAGDDADIVEHLAALAAELAGEA